MRPYGPLRGREHELSTALAVIRRTRTHGASGVVLISGNAGVGKTALLSEICRQAAHMNIRLARSKCDEIEQAWPGAPIVGLLRTGRDPLLAEPEFQQISALIAEPLLLVDRIASHLARLADVQRLLIAVDDVQWADRVSRYALRALISRLVGIPVVWVLASRSDDVGLAASAADSVDVEHIRLGPLPDPAIADIARDRLGPRLDGHIEEMLDAAGGNAFLAVQIIDGLAQHDEADMDGIPAQFRSAVRRRLTGLSVAARQLVEAVAVAGRPVSIIDLVELCEMSGGPADEPAYDQAVNDAVASALIKSTGAELNFDHDLLKDTVYELIAPDVRRRWHARFARHFAENVGDQVLAAAHARVAVSVGDEANARIMLDAAEALITTSAVDAADLALQAFQTLRPGQPRWLELGERVVSVLSRTQRAADTIAVADVLLATVDDADVVGRIETHTVKPMWLSGHSAALLERADRAIARAGTRHDLVVRFRAARALAHTRLLPADQATEEAEAALADARASLDDHALAFALQAAGEAAHNERRHQLALKYFRELRSVTGVPYLSEEIMELQLLDRYDDAQLLLDGASGDSGARVGSILPDLLFARLKQQYNLGQLREADETAALLIELGQVTGTTVHIVEGILMRTTVALLRGESELAAQRLQPALRLADNDAIRHPGLSLLLGWLSTQQGDIDGGRRILSELLETSRRMRSYWAWWPCFATVLFSIGLISGATNISEHTVEFAEEGARRNPDVATLNGLALNLRGMLGRDVAMVAESVQILQHSPRPILRAAGAESYGQLLLAAGDREAGLSQLDTAWDVYDRMGAPAPRARVQRLMREAGARRAKWVGDHTEVEKVSLTEAERRVAYLIASGHTNKSTAKSLRISINTVGTHLRSIYAKLGVQSRVQLANILRELGEIA
jgi:DNA-binding CsgD family transcriptional regulator/tetratricopeptide (TPR) repeat protein